MKKVFSLTLLVLFSCTMPALALDKGDQFTKDGFTYEVESPSKKTVSVVGCSKEGAVKIPSTVKKSTKTYTVVAVGYKAFTNNKSITSVSIPSTVTAIYGWAFLNSTVTSVSIPNSVTEIYSLAFDESQITSLTIPSSVKVLGDRFCYNCSNLQEVTIKGDGLTEIPYRAFDGCTSLYSVSIPNTVTAIRDEAFKQCYSLKSIHLPSGLDSIGKDAFLWSGLTSITIPSKVRYIGWDAFRGTDLIEVDIYGPLDDETNTFGTFSDNDFLKSVTFHSGVKRIGHEMFEDCSSLEEVIIPNTVTEIRVNAFANTNIKSLTIPASVEEIGTGMIYGCNALTEIQVESGNPNYYSSGNCIIEKSTGTLVAGCNTSVIPDDDSVKTIDNVAFAGLKNLPSRFVIPEGVTKIKYGAFEGSSLDELVIASTVDTIEQYALGKETKKCIALPLHAPYYDLDKSWKPSTTLFTSCEATGYSSGQWKYYANRQSLNLYSIEVTSAADSLGTAAIVSHPKECGGDAVVEATPISNNYYFAAWSDGSIDNPYTFPLTQDTVLQAIFLPQTVKEVYFEETTVLIEKGETDTLTPVVLPEEAYNKSVTWRSADETIAVVDSAGVVTAVGLGNTDIIATTVEGRLEATCRVNVPGIVLNDTVVRVCADKYVVVSVNRYPTDWKEKITWSSDNPAIANVNAEDDGGLTARIVGINTGSATISADMNGRIVTCTVHVMKPVESISLDQKLIELAIGGEATLTPTILPENAINTEVIWTIDNSDVATVSNGRVVAYGLGQAIVTATTVDGGKYTSCRVNVPGITLDHQEINLNRHDSIELTAKVYPSDAPQAVTWASNNEAVATVVDGKVKAVGGGDAIITASANGHSTSANVHVWIPVYGVSISPATIVLSLDGSKELKTVFNPIDAMNQSVTWENSNPDIISVDATGRVTAKGVTGNAFVTAITAEGNYSATAEVIVQQLIESISLPSQLSIDLNTTDTLRPTVLPENAAYKGVLWSSDNEDIATVDENGVVSAVGYGTAHITAQAEYGDVKTVVTVHVPGIELDIQGAVLIESGKITLTPTIYPINAVNQEVTWTSLDENVATVLKGEVTAHAAGETKIVATILNTEYRDTCDILVTGVNISNTTLTLKRFELFSLSAMAHEVEDYEEILEWSSSDTTTVLVDSIGRVLPIRFGEAIITAKEKHGNGSASCKVLVPGIRLEKERIVLDADGNDTILHCTIFPEGDHETIVWASNNEAVATVNAGVITPKETGRAIITATTSKYTAYCIVAVRGMVFDPHEATLEAGDTLRIKASAHDDLIRDCLITWHSSDSAVVRVSERGLLTALVPGEVVITAKSTNYEDSCMVTVPGVGLNQTRALVEKGAQLLLIATVYPESATTELTWTSDNDEIATVDADGLVSGVGYGIATITVTMPDGIHKSNCKVMVPGVTFEQTALTLKPTEVDTIAATVYAIEDAAERVLTWTSSDTLVATVDSNGIVTAHRAGTTQITAVTANGKYTQSCDVLVTGVRILADDTTNIAINGSTMLLATVYPLSNTQHTYTWNSSNTGVAFVNSAMGLVLGLQAGTATITVKAETGDSAQCVVNVLPNASGVQIMDSTGVVLNPEVDEIRMRNGRDYQLHAQVLPLNAFDQRIVWSSSDENILAVDSTGKVTAVGYGYAQVMARAVNSGLTEQIHETYIGIAVQGLVMSDTVLTLEQGASYDIRCTSYELSNYLEWTSTNPAVAMLTTTEGNRNTITAVAPGTTTIIVRNDSYIATCKVTVVISVTDIQLNYTELTMNVGQNKNIVATVLPNEAVNKAVNWSSSNPSVVLLMGADGLIFALSEGTSTITATTADGGLQAVCEVTVKARNVSSGDNPATDLENTQMESVSGVYKVFEDGVLYIIRNGEKYTVDGAIVR